MKLKKSRRRSTLHWILRNGDKGRVDELCQGISLLHLESHLRVHVANALILSQFIKVMRRNGSQC
jgi:hypothetical protein